jgi:hypothetical protein
VKEPRARPRARRLLALTGLDLSANYRRKGEGGGAGGWRRRPRAGRAE